MEKELEDPGQEALDHERSANHGEEDRKPAPERGQPIGEAEGGVTPGPSAAGSPSRPVGEPVAEAAVEGTPGEQPACHEYQEHPDSQPSPGDLWKAAWCF